MSPPLPLDFGWSQNYISSPSIKICVLKMLTMWDIMAMLPITHGSAPYYKYTYTSTTPYGIIEDAIENYTPFTLDALGSVDDGIINTVTHDFEVNRQPYDSVLEVVQGALAYTKCYLRAKAGLAFEVIHPQESDSVDETYEAPLTPVTGKHGFYSYNEAHNLLIPNDITVYANAGSDREWTSMVTANEADAQEKARFMTIPDYYTAAGVTSQGDADLLAEAYMAREKSEKMSGKGVIPHDCRIELFDNALFADNR